MDKVVNIRSNTARLIYNYGEYKRNTVDNVANIRSNTARLIINTHGCFAIAFLPFLLD